MRDARRAEPREALHALLLQAEGRRRAVEVVASAERLHAQLLRDAAAAEVLSLRLRLRLCLRLCLRLRLSRSRSLRLSRTRSRS